MKLLYHISFRVTLFTLLCAANIQAQPVKTPNILSYPQFMERVKNNNIAYMVEKYNVKIADANIVAAKVFSDPLLSIGATDNQEHKMKMGYSLDAGLEYTLELGGKRKARIQLAQSEAELTDALLEDYFYHLRADATLAYLEALKQKQLVKTEQESYYCLQRLAVADSIRFKLGSIMEVDARQSKLEAAAMSNEVVQVENDWKNSLAQLSFMQGDKNFSVPDSLAETLSYSERHFDLPSLIATAQNNRSDLQAALRSKEVSQRNLQLAKANRAIDLGINLGIEYNSEVRNELAPAPSFKAVSAGISIPLKFSNTNKGEINAANFAIQQNEAAYTEIELRIQLEVNQAYRNYTTACKQLERFNTGLLPEAKNIFDHKYYSYQRGNTSLLEVLNAQQTYNDIQRNYYETLYNCIAALVELERACGIWDIGIN